MKAPATVSVPAGRLALTSGSGETRIVEIGAFRMGRTPVTNREYAPFLADGGAPPPPWWSDPDFCAPGQPVVGVTWFEATAFCSWLGRISGGVWRLPTEAEWEFAACGGLSLPRTAWGEAIPPREVPDGTLRGPWEAGRGTPNGYGLFDMGTIVHEWCADWHSPETPGASTLRRRASRGGSWRHKIRWSSPSAKSSLPPDYRYSDYGFRVFEEVPVG
jgi:sulfatase modifying factor 1